MRAGDIQLLIKRAQHLQSFRFLPNTHNSKCGTQYRGCAPDCLFALKQAKED